MRKNLIKWAIPLAVLTVACNKNDDETTTPVVSPATGVYVLSEGNFSGNNTKLAFYNIATTTATGSFYEQQNPSQTTGLGDTGNDMLIYGGKLYIVMNGSGQVVVLNAKTGVQIQRINFRTSGGVNKSPRYATASAGKVYVSAYDNTVSVVDTSSLAITNTITVGSNPEGLAIHGNYLYVANSGGLNFPNFDSTVSVVDLRTNAEVKKITVGLNPNKVEVSSTGEVFVSRYGNFSSELPGISVIRTSDNTLKEKLGTGFAYSHLRIAGDIAYFYNNYGGAGTCKVYNTSTNTVVRNEFITQSGVTIATPYGINVDSQNGDVYIMDAKDYVSSGEVTCFNKDGQKKFSFTVAPGVSPNKVVFIR